MSRRERVFISSVQKELAEERKAVRAFVDGDPLLGRFFDVFLFEELPATDRRADAVYLDEVEHSSLYVGIFANEYGREDSAGVSPTEREFDHATALGKVRLVFVKGRDDNARAPKMRALVHKATSQLIRRRFESIPELTTAIYASLVDHLERIGGLRTTPFDAAACPGASVADLSEDKMADFLELARRARGYALGPDTSMSKALAHLNLLDRNAPSHAAVLLFGTRPQRFLPASEIKCLHFHGTVVQKPIPSYQTYRGTVFELVDQAVDFVMSRIARSVGTRAESSAAPVEYELPREAVTEAVVNAVAHRDYSSNASVQVMLFADRLEIWNPGELPPSLTPELLRQPHASIPRNPLLAEPLFLARYIEKAGTGTLDMIARCTESGLRPPGFHQSGGQFVQTLYRPYVAAAGEVTGEVTGEVAGEVTDAVVRLLGIMTGEMRRQEMQEALELRHEEHFRIAYLKPALTLGLVEMTIPEKPTSRLQKYRLTAQGTALLKTLRSRRGE